MKGTKKGKCIRYWPVFFLYIFFSYLVWLVHGLVPLQYLYLSLFYWYFVSFWFICETPSIDWFLSTSFAMQQPQQMCKLLHWMNFYKPSPPIPIQMMKELMLSILVIISLSEFFFYVSLSNFFLNSYSSEWMCPSKLSWQSLFWSPCHSLWVCPPPSLF